MKKNVMMRMAAILMVCVLATTCGISGTFAKYVTTGSASDTARVAKWGVNVFSTTEGTAFAKQYKDSDTHADVVVKSDDFVVAPGTNSTEVDGNLIFGVTGTPEVATRITVQFTGSDIYWDNYHPIKFTLWYMDTDAPIDPNSITNKSAGWHEVQAGLSLEKLAELINANYGSFPQAAGATLDALYMITWEWPIDGDNDLDTQLGNLAANGGGVYENCSTVLNYGVTITVEQVD